MSDDKQVFIALAFAGAVSLGMLMEGWNVSNAIDGQQVQVRTKQQNGHPGNVPPPRVRGAGAKTT